MPGEAPVQEAPPEPLQATPPVSEETPEDIQPGVEELESPEPVAEAPAEETPEEPEDVIAGLPDSVVDEIVRRRGHGSAHMQELLLRERQGATDTVSGETKRAQIHQEELQRVTQSGQQAIAGIQGVLQEANTAMTQALAAARNGDEGASAPRVDQARFAKHIEEYRDAYVRGQAAAWNQEVETAFLADDVVVASISEAQTERLQNAVRACNREGNRVPLLREMFKLAGEAYGVKGHEAALEGVRGYGNRQEAVDATKDGLRRLKESTPKPGPEGTTPKPKVGDFARAGDPEVPDDEIDFTKLRADLAALP